MISRKPDIDEQKDGRIILRGNAWKKMRLKLKSLAKGMCEMCQDHTENGDAHHVNGRGGGRRDDRIFVDGKRNMLYVCRECHTGKHVPKKVVPAKPTEQEFDAILGL